MVIQLPNSVSQGAAQAINELLTAYDTENLRHSLMAYPTRIKAQRDVVQQARKALKDAELERATLEAEMLLLVGNETDEKGKARFSNAEQRAAELLRRKSTNSWYQDAASVVADCEAALTEAQDTLQMLLDEYVSSRIVGRIISAEMSLVSELADFGEIEEDLASGGVGFVPEAQKSLLKEAF